MHRIEGKRERTKRLTTAAVMAALIFAVTWLIRIPVPVSGGAYLNFGDSVIFVCAYIVGGPLAALSAGVGSALADLAGGAAAYALPTFCIKALMGLAVGTMTSRQTFFSYAVACVTGGALMTGGYFLFERVFFSASYALSSLPFNCIQWAGSVLVALVLYHAARRLSGVCGFRISSASQGAHHQVV